jgi:hypothetical protein
MTYSVRSYGSGWYEFNEIPQENRYIKIEALNCGTDRKAINTARKILGDKNAQIEIKGE